MAKKPPYEEMEQKDQLVPTTWRMYLLICIVGLMITGILGYGFFKGNRMNEVYAPLIDAAMEIKLEATTAHLWFEEIINGDRYEDISAVWKHQDRAEWYVQTMLEGGKNPEGTFIPLDDVEMRRKIENVQGKLKEFREIAQERIEAKETSGIGTDIDQRYDHVFRSFLKETDEVETKLQQIMAKDLSDFRHTQVLLIVISLLLFLAIGISFWYFDNQRVKNFLLLNEANRALRESEENISITLNSIGDAVIATDTEGCVIRMNPVAEKLTGWNLSEAKGRPLNEVFDIINEETRQRVGSPVEKVLREGVVVGLANHTILISKHGTEYPVDDSGAPVRDEQGKIEGVVLVFRDVSEKRQAEEELRESEEKYRTLFEQAGDYILMLEVKEDVGLVITDANEAACEIHGHTREKLVGTPISDIDRGLNNEQVRTLIDSVMAGESLLFETKHLKKDGTTFPIEVSCKLLDIAEGPPLIISIERDLTKRKRTEEEKIKLQDQLQQAQKMEAIGTLAGGIAHDFNNLLMAIQGRTSIMLTKKESSHPDIGHLKGIEDNIESAADLTRQLLGFARGGKYEARPTDLNELVKKQNRMFGRTKKQISIRGKYEKDLWSVEVDRGQIEQVLLNLYVNAWQAMPAGGDLYLETENVTLDENYVKPFSIEPGRYVKISVTDTGTGIDKAIQEKIFEPFFTTKEIGRGTGLGLASAYGIIKNHGGFINVYSEKGHGSTFNIYLPASEKEITEHKKSAGETLRGSETVLFVDDEDMIIEIAGEMFEQLGYKVLVARSGKEAIKTYQENKELIDIVLLDMIMPDMSGGDTYDRMKEFDPDVKVLLASGYSINGQATEIMDRGCDGFIQKPFKMKELSQKLREVLDKK